MCAGGKVASLLALGMLGVPSGACRWGQMVSPPCGLCLDLAPESLHRSVLPAHQLLLFSSGLGEHQVQALVLKDWKLWPGKGKCLQSRSSVSETRPASPFIVKQPLARALEPPGAQMATPPRRRRTAKGAGGGWQGRSARWQLAAHAREPVFLPVRPLSSPTRVHAPPAAGGSLTAQQRLGHRPGLFWGHVRGAQEPNAEEEKETARWTEERRRKD